MFETVRQHLAAFDLYPVETFIQCQEEGPRRPMKPMKLQERKLMPVNMSCIPFNQYLC
jgi:hypothetical protein